MSQQDLVALVIDTQEFRRAYLSNFLTNWADENKIKLVPIAANQLLNTMEVGPDFPPSAIRDVHEDVTLPANDQTEDIPSPSAGACATPRLVVHTVLVDHVADPIENSWLADMFAREDHVELRDLAKDVDEYLLSTNTNQG